MSTKEAIFILALVVISWIMMLITGCGIMLAVLREDAVDHGCAEYYLDDHHNRQWRWKQ